MGIYVFTAQFLVDELRQNAEGADPGHDFGHHILPRIMGREPIRAFTFTGAWYWGTRVLARCGHGGRILSR
jgi:ADP-glucose pyrophosphorylase